MLDGQLLFVAPGQKSTRLLPGPHSLVARKAGYFDGDALADAAARAAQRQEDRDGEPGVAADANGAALEVVEAVGAVRRRRRRRARRRPLLVDAKHNFDSFDAEVARSCPNGCAPGTLPSTTNDAHSRGVAENGAAIAMFGVGGAIAVAGSVLLILESAARRTPRRVCSVPVTDLRRPRRHAPLLTSAVIFGSEDERKGSELLIF